MAKRSRQPRVQDPTRPPLKFKVVVPAHDNIPSVFAYDWANLTSHTTAVILANNWPVQFGLSLISGTYVHSARDDLLKEALKEGVTHLLWLDADMRFPKDAFVRLLRHNRSMVGINYSVRGVPPKYVAIKHINGRVRLETTDTSTGLEEVEALGFGCVMMDLRAIGPRLWERPWFFFDWRKGGQVGEDVYFCERIRQTGISIYVDHDLSRDCGHIGQFEYKVQHVSTWPKDDEEPTPVEAPPPAPMIEVVSS